MFLVPFRFLHQQANANRMEFGGVFVTLPYVVTVTGHPHAQSPKCWHKNTLTN